MQTTHNYFATPSRREALFGLGAGLGAVAMSSLLRGEEEFSFITTPSSYSESQTLHISHDGGWPFPYGYVRS